MRLSDQRHPSFNAALQVDLQHCVGRVPTTSLRSLRNCDSSFAAISNHSNQNRRENRPDTCTSLNQLVCPDPAAKILHSQESKNLEARRAFFAPLSNVLAHVQQHNRTAKHSVQKPNTSSHSEAITHTQTLTNPPFPHCQTRT